MKTLKTLIAAVLLLALPGYGGNILALKAGNWNDTEVLNPTPGVGDNVYANSYAIAVNVDATATLVSNVAENGAAAGGSFTQANGTTITANLASGTTYIHSYSGSSPNSAAIIGSSTAGPTTYNILNLGTGQLTLTGTYAGGATANTQCIVNNATGTMIVNGNIAGGPANSAWCVGSVNAGTVIVNGNATGGSSSDGYALYVSSANATLNGVAIGHATTGASGIYHKETGTVTCNGIKYGAAGMSPTFGLVFIVPAAASKCTMIKTDLTEYEMTPGGAAHTTVSGGVW